ncbi:putative transporter YebQ [Geobacter sp. OR-1]|uniref:MFS transporter n=1 Tax=Geobacter sp. OR-1 TaxID=1266765 RepID=UPI00054406A5|nr:MFS transporter [Geobacter sp. OR-1]GAM10370.1 putative transporter YebQ [Geobacter sp. OR-1]
MATDKPQFDLRLAALLIGVILSTVDSSALNLALPSLAAHFGTDAAAVQGASSLYLIGAAIAFLPVSGIAGRIGTVKVYRFSLAAFAIISQILVFSPNLHTLLLLRFVQGIVGAGIVGLVPGMTAATFKENRGWALGMISGSVAAGTLMGPPLGGFLVEWFGWQSIFYINLPFGMLALILSGRLTDLHGVGLIEGLRRAIRAPRFILALLSTVCFFVQSFGINLLWPFYLESGGLSPARVGLMMLVPPLILMMAGPFCGKLSDKVGYDRISWFGSVTLMFASIGQGVTGSVVLGLLGIGLGRALFQAANNAAVLSNAPEGTTTVASGLLSIARVSGQAMGSIVAGTLWGVLEHSGRQHAFLIINLVLAGVAAVSGVLIIGRGRARSM